MNSLLVVNSSARTERSVTRRLTAEFAHRWLTQNPGGQVISRDLAITPPAPIDAHWIKSAFANLEPLHATPSALAASEELLAEIFTASAMVIGAPMYNFGMPAALKAYFDQIVRVGRTFDFDPAAENPYIPLVPRKPVVVITSKGAGGFGPGGPLAPMNFLEPHIEAILSFIGLSDIQLIPVEFEEFHDQRHQDSIEEAERVIARVTGVQPVEFAA